MITVPVTLSPLERQLVLTLPLVIQICKRLYAFDCRRIYSPSTTPSNLISHLRDVHTIHIVFLFEVGFRPSPTGKEKPIKNFCLSKEGGIFHNFVHELTFQKTFQFFYRKYNCRFMVTLYVKQKN